LLNVKGPLKKERIEARNQAWFDGHWVRDGILANARKKAARAASAKVVAE
jgi:ring-1,2-phenylacetyl-CoA epoxidase subunit PaaA